MNGAADKELARRASARVCPLAAAGAVACWALLAGQSVGTSSVIAAAADPRQQAAGIIAELGLDRVTAGSPTGAGDALAVRGYVVSARQKRQLRRRLQVLDPAVRLRVWAEEEIAAAATATLHEFRLDTVRVASAADGRVELHGYQADPGRWRDALRAIAQDIAGVSTVAAGSVVSLEQRLAGLRDQLRRSGLDEHVELAVADGVVTASGALSAAELARWREIERGFHDHGNEWPALRTRLSLRQPLRLAIESVSVGRTPYVTVAEGGRYLQGSTLANGYKVEEIFADRLLLSKDGRTAVYRLGIR